MEDLMVKGSPAVTRVPPCRGLTGLLFGHNFVEAMNQDSAGLSPEQLGHIVEACTDPTMDMITVRHLISTAEPGTTVVKGAYCTRCGEEKSFNGNGNSGK
jgi:hypothetical protein